MAKKSKVQEEPTVVDDGHVKRIARDIIAGVYPTDRIVILTDDIYESSCDDTLNRCHSDLDSIHLFIAPVFNNYRHSFYGGLNRSLLERFKLSDTSKFEDIVKAIKPEFDLYDEIVWSKKIWIHFWVVAAGLDFLDKELQDYFGTKNFIDSLPYLNRETHPAAVRHLNAHLCARIARYPRNDAYDIMACTYLLYFKTMRALNTAIEIDYRKEAEFFKRRGRDTDLIEQLRVRNLPPGPPQGK